MIVSTKGLTDDSAEKLKANAFDFLKSCQHENGLFGLMPNSDESGFTNCFAIFLLNFLGKLNDPLVAPDHLATNLHQSLNKLRFETCFAWREIR